MKKLLRFFKLVLYCIYFSPLVIGLVMIATGNGSKSSSRSNPIYNQEKSYAPITITPTHVTDYARSEEQLMQMFKSAAANERPVNVATELSSGPTPDDAYSEGYDEGYEQGRRDGLKGHGHGYGYDDASSYYDYYETRYQDGYEEGYDEGYSSGYSNYKEEQE